MNMNYFNGGDDLMTNVDVRSGQLLAPTTICRRRPRNTTLVY